MRRLSPNNAGYKLTTLHALGVRTLQRESAVHLVERLLCGVQDMCLMVLVKCLFIGVPVFLPKGKYEIIIFERVAFQCKT